MSSPGVSIPLFGLSGSRAGVRQLAWPFEIGTLEHKTSEPQVKVSVPPAGVGDVVAVRRVLPPSPNVMVEGWAIAEVVVGVGVGEETTTSTMALDDSYGEGSSVREVEGALGTKSAVTGSRVVARDDAETSQLVVSSVVPGPVSAEHRVPPASLKVTDPMFASNPE